MGTIVKGKTTIGGGGNSHKQEPQYADSPAAYGPIQQRQTRPFGSSGDMPRSRAHWENAVAECCNPVLAQICL